MANPRLSVPAIPREPTFIRNVSDAEELFRWAQNLRRELDRFLIEVHRTGATTALVGTRGATTVTAGATLSVEDPIVCLSAASAVTLSATEALKDGLDGQWVLLCNTGTAAITIPHGANTVLSGSGSVVLAEHDSLLLVWDGTDWLQSTSYTADGTLTLAGLTASALVATNADKQLISDTSNYVVGSGVNTITVSPDEPADPEVGDIWVDTDDFDFEVDSLTATGSVTGETSVVAGSGGNTVTLSATGVLLSGDATVWLDSMVPAFGARTAAADLALQAFAGGLYMPRIDLNDEIFGAVQFNHQIKTTGGVQIRPHVHLINKTTIGAATYEVAFEFEWAWGNISSNGLADTRSNPEVFSFANTLAYTHRMFNFNPIDANTKQGGISSLFVFRLKRVTSGTAQAYDTNDIFFGGFDVHYECDTIGSSTASSK